MQDINIAVGSTNPTKVEAVQESIKKYPNLAHGNVLAFNVSSEVSNQPLSMEEIIQGAKNRALNAFSACNNCTYSFGLESGLFEAPGSQTGYLEASICCVFDGKNSYIGLSCGFEVPSQILHFVNEEKMDLSQACYASGITTNAKLGSAEGLIGILTKGRVTRKEYTKQGIIMALAQLENRDLYAPSVSMVKS